MLEKLFALQNHPHVMRVKSFIAARYPESMQEHVVPVAQNHFLGAFIGSLLVWGWSGGFYAGLTAFIAALSAAWLVKDFTLKELAVEQASFKTLITNKKSLTIFLAAAAPSFAIAFCSWFFLPSRNLPESILGLFTSGASSYSSSAPRISQSAPLLPADSQTPQGQALNAPGTGTGGTGVYLPSVSSIEGSGAARGIYGDPSAQETTPAAAISTQSPLENTLEALRSAFATQDYVKARAIARNMPEDAHALGLLSYMVGRGLGGNKTDTSEEALELMNKAISKDPREPYALLIRGLSQAEAWRGAKDDQKAGERDIEAAANAGAVDAMHQLGLMHVNKGALHPSDLIARKWFEKAAEAGSAADMYNIGLMMAEGRGGPRNPVKAKEWIIKAADGGDRRAIELVNKNQ